MTAEWPALYEKLRELTGFALGSDRGHDISAAVLRLQAAHGGTTDDLVARLARGEGPIDALIDDVMIGETYFFREPAHFALLREILPALPAPRRIWSAGCASGEEAYSIAMTLRDLGLSDGSHVLGMDLSQVALARARAGVYTERALRGPDAQRARRFLTRDAGPPVRWRLDEGIRRSVGFRRGNLLTDPFPAEQHVIFCRNVLIYLQAPVIAALARRLYDALAEGGWLILASSDPPLASFAPFRVIRTSHGTFLRKLRVPPSLPPAPRPRAASRRPVTVPPAAEPPEDPVAAVRALADRGDLVAALAAAEAAIGRASLNVELHFLHGVLQGELGRIEAAVASFRRALYLDPGLVAAHLALGGARQRLGDREGARHSFRQARLLCESAPPDLVVPLVDGASAAYLAALAAREESTP